MNHGCIVLQQALKQFTVYLADVQPENRAIFRVIAVRAFIDAPDIQQLLLRITRMAPEGAKSRFTLQAGSVWQCADTPRA